jgi:hypothetical protein
METSGKPEKTPFWKAPASLEEVGYSKNVKDMHFI